jgi:alpha-glucosidase (family GH31 glycosyl hydrolase)
MFVPSLSWQNDRFYVNMAQKCRFPQVYDVFAADSRKVMMDAAVRHYTKQYGIKSWWLDCDEPCGEWSLLCVTGPVSL